MTGSGIDVADRIVMPGEVITDIVASVVSEGERVKLGPGLRQVSDDVVVSKTGIFRYKAPCTFWVECHQKRYVPTKGETVLGVIMGKVGEAYKVDIGSSDYAMLHNLSFEGASKRNKPNLQNGDIVFGKLTSAGRDMEPELSCVHTSSGKAHGMGHVTAAGLLITIPLHLIRKILSPECVLLTQLGKHFKFETIIGMNGKIHIASVNENHVIAIMNILFSVEHMTNEQIEALLNEHDPNLG